MIDHDKLKELASDPNATTKIIFKALGFNNYATFSYQLNKDPEARKIYLDARDAAGVTSKSRERKVSGRRKSTKRQAKRSAPPRNGHAKERISDELLRKIKHEFEHIALYESFTDHFEEIRAAVNAIK